MNRVVIVSGTLGLGTALVFGAAAVASAMFPNGETVVSQWNGGMMMGKGIAVPAPMPAPIVGPNVVIDDGKSLATPDVVVGTP